jgi:hypothetical protein
MAVMDRLRVRTTLLIPLLVLSFGCSPQTFVTPS